MIIAAPIPAFKENCSLNTKNATISVTICTTPLKIGEIYPSSNLLMMTEALACAVKFCFSHTELKRIWTDVDVRNVGSCKVLERCGFEREGRIREGKMVNTWCDYYIYGILRSSRKEEK